MKMGSPLDRMIDQACGLDPSQLKALPMLACPRCKREKRTTLQRNEPKDATRIELPCPDCWKAGEFENPIYFDANGKQLTPLNSEPTT